MTIRHCATTCLLTIALLFSACAHQPTQRSSTPIQQLTSEQLLEVARALSQSGQPLRAQQYLLSALREGAPESVVTPALLRLYVLDGQYRLAMEHAENYTRRHPDHLQVRLFLASLYHAVDLTAEALHEYRALLSARPNDAQAHFQIASLLRQQGTDLGGADEHYRSYLTLDPHGTHAAEARAQLLTEVP